MSSLSGLGRRRIALHLEHLEELTWQGETTDDVLRFVRRFTNELCEQFEKTEEFQQLLRIIGERGRELRGAHLRSARASKLGAWDLSMCRVRGQLAARAGAPEHPLSCHACRDLSFEAH